MDSIYTISPSMCFRYHCDDKGFIKLINKVKTIKVANLFQIHRLYRNTGASFEQAQREFASGVLSNKNVQNAAATVITESAKATVQNYNSSGGTSSTPGRF